jgi:hypothetical protein
VRDRNATSWGAQPLFAISMLHYHRVTDAIEIASPLARAQGMPTDSPDRSSNSEFRILNSTVPASGETVAVRPRQGELVLPKLDQQD